MVGIHMKGRVLKTLCAVTKNTHVTFLQYKAKFDSQLSPWWRKIVVQERNIPYVFLEVYYMFPFFSSIAYLYCVPLYVRIRVHLTYTKDALAMNFKTRRKRNAQ